MTQKAVEAVVLDMDGLLIDTEPTWRAAETATFAGFGIALSDRDVLDSTGQPIEELIPVWRQRPTADGDRLARLTDAEVADLVIDRVIAHVRAEGEPMPGVTAALALFERYGLRLAIASSSPRRLIDAVCDRLGLGRIEVRCSAMDEARGKPAPDVYLTAARRLGVAPANCLALEDSPNGVASARTAGMRCLAVPDPLLTAHPRYREADLVLGSLTQLDDAALQQLGVPVRPLRRSQSGPYGVGVPLGTFFGTRGATDSFGPRAPRSQHPHPHHRPRLPPAPALSRSRQRHRCSIHVV